MCTNCIFKILKKSIQVGSQMKALIIAALLLFSNFALATEVPDQNLNPSESVKSDVVGTISTPTTEQNRTVKKAAKKAKRLEKKHGKKHSNKKYGNKKHKKAKKHT